MKKTAKSSKTIRANKRKASLKSKRNIGAKGREPHAELSRSRGAELAAGLSIATRLGGSCVGAF